MEKFVLRMVVDSRKGVMARIATLLARKGYNILSICVGKHLESGEASIVLTVMGEQAEVENAKNLLGKLVNVISIEAMHESEAIERELCLIKVKKAPGFADALNGFNAKVIKEADGFAVLELVDYPARVEEFVSMARKDLQLIDISRSGANAI